MEGPSPFPWAKTTPGTRANSNAPTIQAGFRMTTTTTPGVHKTPRLGQVSHTTTPRTRILTAACPGNHERRPAASRRFRRGPFRFLDTCMGRGYNSIATPFTTGAGAVCLRGEQRPMGELTGMPTTRMRRPLRRALFLVSVAALALLTFATASAQSGQPKGITDEARDMHTLYVFTLVMAVVVFVLVEAALVYAIVKFRKKNDVLPAQTHGSTIIEMIWTGIPVLIVISLFTYSFIVLRNVENDPNPAAVVIDVTGFQYQWEFAYHLDAKGANLDPDSPPTITQIGTAADEPILRIPVDEPIEFRLKSNDVIHSFYVRDFLYKLDVIPGRDNRFTVTAREEGTYIGQCAELCGLNHALMRFQIEVMSREKFNEWVASESAAASPAARVP
ncbi:MAG: cytochrome c oxidase subunit II [Anaerolinea sp.]|nr:cytochrome c oxidase subunit II [Anaerolinea sp.]